MELFVQCFFHRETIASSFRNVCLQLRSMRLLPWTSMASEGHPSHCKEIKNNLNFLHKMRIVFADGKKPKRIRWHLSARCHLQGISTWARWKQYLLPSCWRSEQLMPVQSLLSLGPGSLRNPESCSFLLLLDALLRLRQQKSNEGHGIWAPICAAHLLRAQLGCLGLCQVGVTAAVLQGGAEGVVSGKTNF